jgi:hypothetical protein
LRLQIGTSGKFFGSKRLSKASLISSIDGSEDIAGCGLHIHKWTPLLSALVDIGRSEHIDDFGKCSKEIDTRDTLGRFNHISVLIRIPTHDTLTSHGTKRYIESIRWREITVAIVQIISLVYEGVAFGVILEDKKWIDQIRSQTGSRP